MISQAEAEQSLHAHFAGEKVDWRFVVSALRKLPVATESKTRKSVAVDPMGRRLLIDLLSKDPPVDAVEACLRAFPDALTMNVSAYFTACRCQDLSVFTWLIRYSLRRETYSKCPYSWITMSHVSFEAAQAIIREYPLGVLQQCTGSEYCLLDQTLFVVDNIEQPQLWDKLVVMLKAAEHSSLDEKKDFHPIHTLVHRVVTRSEFFEDRKNAQRIVWLLHQLHLLYPELFRILDSNGNAPLHIALEASCLSGPGTVYAQNLVSILVDSYKGSASLVTPKEGRLPMVLALENEWPCHDILLRAAPHSLHRRDPVTCLYPFQIAACAKLSRRKNPTRVKVGDGHQELNIIYSLLRQDPLFK